MKKSIKKALVLSLGLVLNVLPFTAHTADVNV